MKILREILEDYMSQVQVRKSGIAELFEGLKSFLLALTVYEQTESDSEEIIKRSGIEELINSGERIKNMELIFEAKEPTIKKVKENLHNEELDKSPKIKNSIIKTNIQETERDEDER